MTTGIGGGVLGAFQFDRVMSGALLQLGSVFHPGKGEKRTSIGGFTNELVSWGKGAGALQRMIYYYVPSGKKAGAGRLSLGMATDAAAYIREGMKDPTLRKQRYKGPPLTARSEIYQEWVDQISKFKDTPVLSLTGWSADFFGIIRTQGEGVSLGINPEATTRSPIRNKVPLEYSSEWSNISSYMRSHELGLRHFPARPLMTGLVLGYLQDTDTVWADLFEKSMLETYWNTYKKAKKTSSLSDVAAGSTGGPAALSQGKVIHQYNAVAAVLDHGSALLEENFGMFLQGSSDKFAGEGVDAGDRAEFVKFTRTMLRGWGRTEKAIDATIKAVQAGKRIKDY